MEKSFARSYKTSNKIVDNTVNKKMRLAVEWLEAQPDKALELVNELLTDNNENPLLWVIATRANLAIGEFSQADVCIDKALKIDPGNIEVIKAKSDLLYRCERMEEANVYLTDAITRITDSDSRPLRLLHATILQKTKKYEDALDIYQQLTNEEPKNWLNWHNLGLVKQDLSQFSEMDEAYERSCLCAKDNPQPYFSRIVGAHYDPQRSAEDILVLCKAWQEKFKVPMLSRAVTNDKKVNKCLRIGIISDGLRLHPVGQMIITVLENIPASQIEFYAYSTNYKEDHLTYRLKGMCKKWMVIEDASVAELDKIIRADKIDILFDLCGYNANSRMQNLQLAPAPLQIKWVGGLISSTGLETIDYLLSDSVETPEWADSLYTEKLIRMPDDYICYDPPSYLPEINDNPFVTNGFITFGCFNNATKINDTLLAQWAILMHNVPSSRLFLKSFNFDNKNLAEHVLSFLETQGIKRERVRIEGMSPHQALLASYNDVDIALDPWPYSGGLTTCEAMAMGIPVVTLPGPTFAGRHSASHLVNAGLSELVATDWEHYINITVGLTKDLESLIIIRKNLRNILFSSPVCDGQQFAKNFTDAMRAIWQRYCEGKQPAALTLSNDTAPFFHDDHHPIELQHAPAAQTGFHFQLKGKICMLDYSGSFATSSKFIKLNDLNAFHFILLDLIGKVEEKELPLRRKNIQHITLHALGDGENVPVYMCMDNNYSSDLKPLVVTEPMLSAIPDKQIIAEVVAPSSQLDAIDGLESIEWLVLDNKFNINPIFKYGRRIISTSLVIDICLTFNDTHEGQLSFSDVNSTLKEFGFYFHSFLYTQFGQPVTTNQTTTLPSSKVLTAHGLWLPNADRLASMSMDQREKLTFILHTVYGLHDVAFQLLQRNTPARAELYINEISPPNIVKARKHSLPQKLIVSLTSWHKRFSTLNMTLKCLLQQSVKADRIILWLAESERHLVPDDVLSVGSQGVEIKYCNDIKSYKKIVPTLIEEPNAFIVTADDDLSYDCDWLEKLVAAWDGNYKTVVAHRAHKIRLDKDGLPIPYRQWDWNYAVSSDVSSLVFPTSGAGVLYPPHCFYPDIINKDLFEKLSPNADDVWLYWMCRLNDIQFKVVDGKFKLLEWEGISNHALWHENLLNNANDNCIKNMISHYGFMRDNHKYNVPVHQEEDVFTFAYAKKMVCMYLPNKFDHIQRVVKMNHAFYESDMLEDIASKTKPGSTIIDIGANIGNHSVYFGLFCSAGKVLSFEPQDEVYETLLMNISMNYLNDKVNAFKMGLGSYETTATLGAVDAKNIGMTKLEIDKDGSVHISTLDSMIEREPKNSVSVIKIDVEGMEMEVLRGAVKTLEYHSPVIYAEAASQPEFDEVSTFLAKFNYVATKRFNATATYLFEKHI
ncbi:FkbM family methyltransferase [Enterobacter hormaechei]